MSNVVSQPTPEILGTTDLIEQGLARFIQARFAVTLSWKRESALESMLLLNLVIRNMEAILELARKDLVLLPAANVLARAVFEIAIKSAWMVQPDDPYMRELRWLVHLEEEARLHEQVVKRVTESGGDPSGFQERAAICRGFVNGVSGKLPPGYQKIPGNPSVDSMLKDIGQKKMYPVYTMLAAYVHGGHASTWLYRKHLGTEKEFGEFIEPADWYLPLWSSWSSVHFLGQYVLERLGAREPHFVNPAEAATLDQAFASLNPKAST